MWKNKKVVVTGGAGFIGSHLVDKLLEKGAHVVVYDNLSSGKKEFLDLNNKNLEFVLGDVLDEEKMKEIFSDSYAVFHLAANPDVKLGAEDTYVHFEQNALATYRVLRAVGTVGVKKLYFTSTSTVYGEAKILPTPEEYGPLLPISLYGASKLAAEAFLSAYSDLMSMNIIIYRFANVIGPRSTHGVIYDFINKLRKNKKELTILGDGTQKKSYLYIDDCVNAMLYIAENSTEKIDIFNLGSEDTCTVNDIADAVCEVLGLMDTLYKYTGGVNGGKGWKGDVKYMHLSIERLKKLGFKPKYNSMESVRKTAYWLAGEE